MFDRVIVTTGMPRSGTSWLGEIVNSSPLVRLRVSPPFSYELKNCIDRSAGRAEWDAMLVAAYRSADEFMDQTYRRRSGEYPTWPDKRRDPPVLCVKFDRFLDLVEPMLALYPDLKVVAIVRHPCGAIHSWLTAPREFPPEADPRAHWRSGAAKKAFPGDFFGFEDWKAMTRMHCRLAAEQPARVRLVRYENLAKAPVETARDLFDFLDLPFGAQTRAFLDQCHREVRNTVYSVFKPPSVKDRWRREMDPAIRDAILSELAGSDLEAFAER